MDDSAEYALVIKALKETLSTSVYWDDRASRKVREDRDLRGFTPEGIQRLLCQYVRDGGVRVIQKKEEWEGYREHYRFRYYAVLPVDEFKYGLFVEFRLVDDCPEFSRGLLGERSPGSQIAMKSFPRKCANCRERAVNPVTLPSYSTEMDHDGKSYQVTVDNLPVLKCSRCESVFLDDAANERLSVALRKEAGLLLPSEIRAGRERHGFTQKALANLMRIGESTLSRWETGVQIQQRSMDLFLRSIFALPELRTFLEAKQTAREGSPPLSLRASDFGAPALSRVTFGNQDVIWEGVTTLSEGNLPRSPATSVGGPSPTSGPPGTLGVAA